MLSTDQMNAIKQSAPLLKAEGTKTCDSFLSKYDQTASRATQSV